jgi:hypothetical protein
MARRPGDYSGDPTKRARGFLRWVDKAQTQITVVWQPAEGVDPFNLDHVILYVNGVADANRANRTSQIITAPEVGVLPHVCAVYVPEVCDYDNAYDPIGGNPAAQNCFLVILGVVSMVLNKGFSMDLRGHKCLRLNPGFQLVISG